MAKVAPILYGDRKVYTVSSFNRGIGSYSRLPAVWVEGEVTELRRNEAWATVFLTLKDPKTRSLARGDDRSPRLFDRLELALEEGETVHVAGRAELYEQKGELGLRASTIERIGLGAHLLALERLKQGSRPKGSSRRAKASAATAAARDRDPHRSGCRSAWRSRRDDRSALSGGEGRGL